MRAMGIEMIMTRIGIRIVVVVGTGFVIGYMVRGHGCTLFCY